MGVTGRRLMTPPASLARVLGRFAAFVSFVVLIPSAAAMAAAPVSGALRLDPNSAWAGGWEVETQAGAFNVSAGLLADDVLVLRSASFSGYHMDKPRMGTDAGPGVFPTFAGTRTEVSGAGEIEIRCKKVCGVLLVAANDAVFTLTGQSAGEALSEDAPTRYSGWSGNPENDEDFYYGVPADHLALGGGALGAAEARATGNFTVLIMNATVRATLDEGPQTWDLGRDYEELASSPLGSLKRIRDRFLVLELKGGEYFANDSRAVLHAAPQARFTGELVARAADGTLEIDGTPEDLTDERLVLRGDLVFGKLAAETTADFVGGRTLEAIVIGDFTGTAERVRVASEEIVQPPAMSPAARASLVALLVTALALLLWIPLYSRLDRARVLTNPTRARILELLRASPGLTAPAIAREIGKARAVAIHHLAMLEGHRFVAHRRVGWAIHYYLPDGAPEAGSMLASFTLADETRRRIAVEVARGIATQSELVVATGASQRLVSYHLGKLEKAGLVQAIEGRPRRFAPTTPLIDSLRGELSVRA